MKVKVNGKDVFAKEVEGLRTTALCANKNNWRLVAQKAYDLIANDEYDQVKVLNTMKQPMMIVNKDGAWSGKKEVLEVKYLRKVKMNGKKTDSAHH